MKNLINKLKNSLANCLFKNAASDLCVASALNASNTDINLRKKKPGAITIIEIIIIIVIVVAVAILFKDFISGVVTDIGDSVKTSISNLFN